MSLKEISSTDLIAVSGGADTHIVTVVPNFTIDQFFMNFLATVSSDELKNFIKDNVYVDINIQATYYPQLESANSD